MPHRESRSPPTSTRDRQWDLDWLRILAFGLLIFFHTAILFLPDGIPAILNAQASPALALFVAFLHQFRLSLLFLISGVGVYYCQRGRSLREFFVERAQRLLIPLLFGICVLVPPMVYSEHSYNARISMSYLSFYPTFFTAGIYPAGNLSWHHFWYLAYLFIFCVLAWPLIAYWRTASGQAWLDRQVRRLSSGYGLFWPCVPFIITEWVLRPIFPGFRDLIHDWASFSHWFIAFSIGYFFAARREMLDLCRDLRRPAFICAVGSSFLLFALFYDYEKMEFILRRELNLTNVFAFLSFSAIRILAIWTWLVCIIGFARRHLARPSSWLPELNRAVYPMFCLHLPLIVCIAYWVLPLPISIAAKFSIIVFVTVAGVSAITVWVLPRSPWLALCLGTSAHAARNRVQ